LFHVGTRGPGRWVVEGLLNSDAQLELAFRGHAAEGLAARRLEARARRVAHLHERALHGALEWVGTRHRVEPLAAPAEVGARAPIVDQHRSVRAYHELALVHERVREARSPAGARRRG